MGAASVWEAGASESRSGDEPPPRPNIVVFLSDDLPWGQPGFNGGTEVASPSLDRIAREGVRLTDFYAQPQCSPTRAALLTGRYPWKNGMELRPDGQSANGLLLDERTLAQALRDAGYATWIVGKWHLGQWRHEHLPLQRGFDHHYGHYSAQIDSFTHQRGPVLDWHRNGRPVVESGYSTFLLANEAVRLIERHDGSRPFFLYLPFNAVHEPVAAPKEYFRPFEDSPNGMFKAMFKAMDVGIGRVLGALEDTGVLDETLVVFLNDNGGRISDGGNVPYREGKASFLEGGVRVPAAMRWPAEIEAGSERDALLHVVDLFPTFAGLAGADTDAGLPLDGLDAWDAIAGDAPSPRTEIVFSRGVIRVGDWKLIERNQVSALGTTAPRMLFNLAEDPHEWRSLASAQGGKVERLRARLRHHGQFARSAETAVDIPDFPPTVYGAAEDAAYGAEVERAVRERAAGNPGPALVWLEADGDRVTLVFDEALAGDSVPSADAFRVLEQPRYTAVEITDVTVSGRVVLLTLAEAAQAGTRLGLTYEVPDAGAIRDTDGTAAAGVVWATGAVSEEGVGGGFTLVRVGAQGSARDVMEIAEGATLDLSEWAGDRFSIRADMAAAVGSVSMHLVGPLTAAEDHDTAPYVVYPTPGGGYEGRRLPNGAYRIAAVAYADAGLTGDVLDAWTVPFSVTGSFDPDETPLEGFALVEADGDRDVRALVDGETVDAALLSGTRHTVRVLLSDEAVIGSVLLDVDTPWKTFAWGRGLGPYAVHPVLPGGDYQGMPLLDGDYRVTATVYDGSDLGGGVVEQATVRFSVTGGRPDPGGPLTGVFTLVHSAGGSPDADAALVEEGTSLDLPALKLVPNRFTLRADTRADVGSVKLALSGPLKRTRVDNGPAPYTLHGDDGHGDYAGERWPAGNYRVTAHAYDEADGGGTELGSTSASFEVVRSFDLSASPVTGLSLVDADTGERVAGLGDETLVLVDAAVSARGRATVRAHAPEGLGGVRLELAGPVSATRTDGEAPYTLHGDGQGMVLEPGDYRVTATAYLDAAREHPFPAHAGAFSVHRGARPVARGQPDLPASGNGLPWGLWSDGETLWVSDVAGGRVYAYGLQDGVRQRERDIATAASGNGSPTGLWSNGETLWVGDSAAPRVFAYGLAGERRESRDITLGSALASDLWGDGETLWVLDDLRRLRAYSLADGARRPARDVALDSATVWPTGVWSDGQRVLVLDAGQRRPQLHAYRDGALSAAEGLALPAENGLPQALWSDGHALWVTDGLSGRPHTYALEPPSSNATLTLLRLSDVDIGPYAPSRTTYTGETSAAATTVTAYGASGAKLTITPADADPDTDGHQVSLSDVDNGIAVTVTAPDGTTKRTYAVSVMRVLAASEDARLRGLTLSGAALAGFDSGVTEYRTTVAAAVASIDVRATPMREGAAAVIEPADADPDTDGHQVALAEGDNAITVTVTAADGVTTRSYTVTVTRAPAPVVSLVAAAATVSEGSPAVFTATLSDVPDVDLSVPVTVTEAGSVLVGDVPSALAFAARSRTAELSVATVDDTVEEGDGAVTATLVAGAGYTLGDPSSATVTVTDDDVTQYRLALEPEELAEGAAATVTVSTAGMVTRPGDRELELRVSGLSAADYRLEPSTVVLGPEATARATATLTALDDGLKEPPERGLLTLLEDGAERARQEFTIRAGEKLYVSGVPQVGGTLTAPELAGTGSTEHQWLRKGEAIPGATGPSHVLAASDEGAELSVRVTRTGVTRLSEATVPIWGVPGNPPLGADEEELLGTLLTVGFTRVYPIRLGGYGRVSRASFGSLDDTTLSYGGASVELTVALVNELGEFSVGPPLGTLSEEVLWAYWDGHRIGPLVRSGSSELEVLSAPTPQERVLYRRYGRAESEGVRVALSLRRELLPPAVTLSVESETVSEGTAAVFELSLDRAPGTALEVPVEVTWEGDVLGDAVPASVTVEAGSTSATLVLPTVDDTVGGRRRFGDGDAAGR